MLRAVASWYKALRPIAFAIDPELAHRLALRTLSLYRRPQPTISEGQSVDVMGLRFPNRVGLAAGFDKNAEAVNGIARLGFGFIEVGTVTPKAQSGQPRPRLFRLTDSHALINRLGFPNVGAQQVAANLRRARYDGVLGVNIGKNASTPLESASEDFVYCLQALSNHADYIAINISSPNTASLRELHSQNRLGPLLERLAEERSSISRRRERQLPLVLKISPDLDSVSVARVGRLVVDSGWDGLIATNTTVHRHSRNELLAQAGGLSGQPLHELTLRVVRLLREAVGPQFPIIGVGGIDSSAKAKAMCAAGADLIQLYTGLIFEGPTLVRGCIRALGEQSTSLGHDH